MTPARHGDIAVGREGRVAVLTIDRPQSANAINSGVADGLAAALAEAALDDGVGAVVLTGSGARVFCAGVDLREGQGSMEPEALAGHRAARILRSFDAMLGFHKPLVTAVNGVASGGGGMLAILGDRILASETAVLVMPEIDLGMPSFIGLEMVSWAGGEALAVDLMLTGRRLGAAEGQARGAFSRVVEPAALLAAALGEAAGLAEKPAFAYAMMKQAIEVRRRPRLNAALQETETARPLVLAAKAGRP